MPAPFHISRRSFVKRCAATAAATGLPLWFLERELAQAADQPATLPASPNDRPNIALIGCGSQGTTNAQAAARSANIVAVCDPDEGHLNAAASRFTRNGAVPAKFADFRELLKRDDLHAVINATPDHWHTLINLAAARAKKDIYGQKPLTLCIAEGRHVIKAVRDNQVVFQTGSQQRSDRNFRLACELVRNGRIGKLSEVQVWVPAGLHEGPFQTRPVPPALNWDWWQGQTPKVEYVPQRCHGTFRWWWDYAGGPVTDWGAHHNDIARWGIGQDGPLDVEARVVTGPIEGGYTTPSEFEATLNWANGIRETVKTTTDDAWSGSVINRNGQRNGVKFIGSDGWIWVNRGDLSASKDEIYLAELPANALRLEVSTDHMQNFLGCMRSRKDPIASVEVGHYSTVVGHLIIIALRAGKKYQWDAVKEVFTGEGAAEANAHLAREMRKPYDYSMVG
jgi:predicted dehydrogenase